MTVAAQPREKEKAPAKVLQAAFRERIRNWQINKKHRPRRWVLLTMPFKEARIWFRPQEYDFKANTGEQREAIESWVNKLKKEMEHDNFAPAIWSASLRQSHLNRAEFHEDGTVTLHVTSQNPLPHIDGNHRGRALRKIHDLAERDGDLETMGLVDDCEISVQVYLEPDRSRETFQVLQEGKKASGDLLDLQRKRRKDAPPDEKMALAVAVAVASNRDSHLYEKISWGKANSTNMIGLKTATATSASELACSLYGGVKIAMASGRDARWLESCYVEAWDAIEKYCRRDDLMGVEIPAVLMPGKLLCSLGKIQGRKSGTTLITGVGNMWAYLKGFRGAEAATEHDKRHIATIVDLVLDESNRGGLDAPRKRTLMGEFARTFFESIVLRDGEKPRAGRVAGVDGIPLPLYQEILSPSAFGPRRESEDDIYEDVEESELALTGTH